MEREYLIPTEDVWKISENKYKAIVVIGKEAKRIQQFASETEESPIALALDRFLSGEIEYEEGHK